MSLLRAGGDGGCFPRSLLVFPSCAGLKRGGAWLDGHTVGEGVPRGPALLTICLVNTPTSLIETSTLRVPIHLIFDHSKTVG